MNNASHVAKPKSELMQTRQLVASDMEKVNALIIAYAQSDIALIGQMVRHLVLSGGKRLRPALVLLCARLMGYDAKGERHIALAAAVEFIHTATLLHDDVVDESELRRGEETANEVWGNSASVLVGDFLLSRAFQLMVSDGELKVLKILSDASAIIAQGEVLQLTTANALDTTLDQYLQVITGKTATLFAAACELGAVVTQRAEWEEPLREFGMHLGIAFQMMDDALDYSAKQEALGKNIGDDFRDGKITLPIIHAYARGTNEEKQFWQRTLGEQNQTELDLANALHVLNKYQAVEHTVQVARNYCDKAIAILADLEPSDEKTALLEIADFCINRVH